MGLRSDDADGFAKGYADERHEADKKEIAALRARITELEVGTDAEREIVWSDGTGRSRCKEPCPVGHEHCYTCRLPEGHNDPHLHECEVDALRIITKELANSDPCEESSGHCHFCCSGGEGPGEIINEKWHSEECLWLRARRSTPT